MKYRWWWVCLVVLAAVCGADVVCFAFTGVSLFYSGEYGGHLMARACIGVVALVVVALVAIEGFHLSERIK